jgi:hypothetical protein
MDTLAALQTSQPPESLYHYTNAAALHEILASRMIRATMLHYLNDAKEFRHGLHWARYEILQAAQRATAPTHRDLITQFADSLERIENLHICVFCMSETRDLLSQWRSYCPPDGGYALGFDTSRLAAMMAGSGFRLVKCSYDVTSQRAIISEILTAILPPHLAELDAGRLDVPRALEGLLDAFRTRFALPAAVFKDPSFSEEREWRLVSPQLPSDHANWGFRPHKGMLVPYFDINLRDEPPPFGPIIVGPNPHQHLASNALLVLLSRLGIRNWKAVELSQIPYRPL